MKELSSHKSVDELIIHYFKDDKKDLFSVNDFVTFLNLDRTIKNDKEDA
jgi:hypothetical protein